MSDIFVSYAHVDDDLLTPAKEGWVTTFVDNLNSELGRYLGRKDAYSLWMDYEMRGNQSITREIREKVQNSRAFLMFLSPGYVASDWCQEEMNLFLDQEEECTGRVFIVRLDDTETPETLREKTIKGYEFWERDRSDRVRLLATPEPDPEERQYYRLLGDVAYDLKDLIKADRASANDAQETSTTTVTVSRTVYLAQVPESLNENRNQVRRFLEQLNVRVLPTDKLPILDFGQAVDSVLEASDFFIQLLNGDSGQQLPLSQFQRWQNTELPILQWRSHGIDTNDVGDVEHQRLIQGETVIASTLVTFQSMMKDVLFEPPKPTAHANGNDLLVFVDAAQEDLDLAYEASSALEDNGVGFSLPVKASSDLSPSDIRLDFENNVLNCDVVLMIYRKGPVTQARKRLLRCNGLRAKREKPLRMLAVCTGQDFDEPLNLRLPGMQVFNAPDPCPNNCVKAVLDAIQT